MPPRYIPDITSQLSLGVVVGLQDSTVVKLLLPSLNVKT